MDARRSSCRRPQAPTGGRGTRPGCRPRCPRSARTSVTGKGAESALTAGNPPLISAGKNFTTSEPSSSAVVSRWVSRHQETPARLLRWQYDTTAALTPGRDDELRARSIAIVGGRRAIRARADDQIALGRRTPRSPPSPPASAMSLRSSTTRRRERRAECHSDAASSRTPTGQYALASRIERTDDRCCCHRPSHPPSTGRMMPFT